MVSISRTKAIFYYSMSGNTKALVELCNTDGFDLYNLATISPSRLDFKNYKALFIGTSTVGKGVPHEYFKMIYNKLLLLEGRRIILFGSGNSIYDVYCGALDVIGDVLKDKNKIVKKFRFESYPTAETLREFQVLIDDERNLID
ncbi:flavodoxin family protein [Paenibacillus xylanexedens]|uniref:flavodoxin family protein n=1 Tax=Paenibacillus xylanexedens TaxID=528191 RepID=UPI00142E8DEA|nr:flavodoxin domain-containing protein [Paenibacillus xylanexedens]